MRATTCNPALMKRWGQGRNSIIIDLKQHVYQPCMQSSKHAFKGAKPFVEKMNWTPPHRSPSFWHGIASRVWPCTAVPTSVVVSTLQTSVLGLLYPSFRKGGEKFVLPAGFSGVHAIPCPPSFTTRLITGLWASPTALGAHFHSLTSNSHVSRL